MAGTPQYYDAQGNEMSLIKDAIPPVLGGIMGSMDMDLDKFLMNMFTGNPYAHQQARLGGRPPAMSDILIHEQQQTFFKFGGENMKQQKQAVLNGFYGGVLGDTNNNRATNAANSIFSPVGMAAQLAMQAHGDQAAIQQSYGQGFRSMNLFSSGVSTDGIRGGAFNREMDGKRKGMDRFVNQMQGDYFDDPNSYGGFNLQGTSEVFQQMASRSLIGEKGMDEGRVKQTSMKVKEMSQAVGAMQELFSGTIPEIFDKMDAIFGGTAGAMGGQALQGRISRMKQTSMITGQSLQATAQAMITGQQYATSAGFDAGIGAAAAEENNLAMGVNVGDSGISMRRVNMGRVRGGSLRGSVAATTSRQAQYYAGAYQIWLEGNRDNFQNSDGEFDAEAASNAFRSDVGSDTSLRNLANVAGSNASDVQSMSMSNRTRELMMDDRNVAQVAIQARANKAQDFAVQEIRGSLRRRGINVSGAELRDEKGNLRGRQAIIDKLIFNGANSAQAKGAVDNALEGAASQILGPGANASELEVYFAQQNNVGKLREVQEARSKFDAQFGRKQTGVAGVLNLLARSGEKNKDKDIAFGELLSAGVGAFTTKEINDALGDGSELAGQFRRMHSSQKLNRIQKGKVATIATALADGKLAGLSEEAREKVIDKLTDDGGFEANEIDDLFQELGTDKQKRADQVLKDSGLGAEYSDALQGTDKGALKEISLRSSAKEAIGDLKGTADEGLQDKLRKALIGEDGKMKFKSLSAAEDAIKNIKFSTTEAEEAFKKDFQQNASALEAGDPALKLNDLLSKLNEVLEKLANGQNTEKPKAGE